MATPRADGDDQPVRVIGRYELVSATAQGALGELWKARIVSGPEQGRIVAIRRIPRTAALDRTAVERLTNAGFAAMEVRHPKIAAVLDVVVADSEIALVSEYIEGALLQALLRPPQGKRATVSPDVALRIVLDVLESVEAARVQWKDLFPSLDTEEDRLLAAAVHGGLMPDSVFLASFGEAMLLDAGLAGIAMTMHPILDHADVIAYRAPEQLEPGGPADERADVFTAGLLVWELLAARPLFAPAILARPAATDQAVKTKAFSDAMQISTVRRKVLTASIQRLDSLPLLKGRVSRELADVVARCLERDPGHRFQSVREVIERMSDLGPKAVAGYDAVSRLLHSIGAAPANEDAPAEFSSSRTTSNRPTVPPEKAGQLDSSPPNTRRNPNAGAAAAGTDVTPPNRSKIQTVPGEDADVSLSAADIQSIPPSSDAESSPPSMDVESLPAPSDGSGLAPTPLASEPATAGDGTSVPAPLVALPTLGIGAPVAAELASATELLARVDETSSAPVVRAVGDDGGLDLSSTIATPHGNERNRKLVVGVVAGAGLLALVGLIRVVTSGHSSDAEPPSASAASSVAPPAVMSAPAEVPGPIESAAEPEGTAATAPPEAPTSSPSPPPAPATPASPLKRQPPAKKKPFRPSAI